MVLGMSPETFTLVHVVLSLVGSPPGSSCCSACSAATGWMDGRRCFSPPRS